MLKIGWKRKTVGRPSFLLLGDSSIYTGAKNLHGNIVWSSLTEIVQTTLLNHATQARVVTLCKWGKGLPHFCEGLKAASSEKGSPFDSVVVSYFLNDRVDYNRQCPIFRGDDEERSSGA